jgi:extradiol dioxygenase family protein
MDPILHLSLPVSDLAAARSFYADTLGCRVGRVRAEWIDVWFYGMQLTLHARPAQVLPREQQGVRHFGVTLPRAELDALIERLEHADVEWVGRPTTDTVGVLQGKTNVKIADPSGNVVELKAYPDAQEAFSES